MTKDETVRIIQQMPEDFELDDLIEKLILVENINIGRQEIKDGKGIPHVEVKKIVSEWHK